MKHIIKKLLQPIEQLQSIRGVDLPVGVEFLQLIVTGPPGAGKTYYINQIRGWPNEGYLDLTAPRWWKNQSLIYRPREVHLGLPFHGFKEALTVFDKEWVEAGSAPLLDVGRINIPPTTTTFFNTNWRQRYVFEFILPEAQTIYARRKARHQQGYFPVDENLTFEMVVNQVNTYAEVALLLHRAGVHVYIREDLDSPPLAIVEKGDPATPIWLLPKNEQSARLHKRRSWKHLFLKTSSYNWITVSDKVQEITTSSRIAHDGKTFELRLDCLPLHFHPEIPLGVRKKQIEKNWLIFSPLPCNVKNVTGFARLKVGESMIVSRENKLFVKLFDIPKNFPQRYVRISNRYGDIIITPLVPEYTVGILRVEDQDNREQVESCRYDALLTIKEIYGETITPLAKPEALARIKEANRIILNDKFALVSDLGKAGGIIRIPNDLTPVIIGDLHGQVDNLLKIITENHLIEWFYANTACLIILGDAVHSEVSGEMEDMESSTLMMDLLLTLKVHFPGNVFYLRGNHDSFAPEVSKNGISQGLLMKQFLLEIRGEEYVQEMQLLYDHLPYIACNDFFYSCHAAPPIKKVTFEELVNIHNNPALCKEITSNRLKRAHYINGYNKKDVRRFRKTLGMAKGTHFIVGHTPLDPFKSYWGNAGNIKNHHILYSGHQEGAQAIMIEEKNLIPLSFPHEPVTKVLEKLR